MEREDMMALADKCQGAEGPDRELDIAIGLAALGWCWVEDEFNYSERWQILDFGAANNVGWYADGIVPDLIPSPTASLDAAMSLLPEGEAVFWRVGNDGEGGNPPDFMAEVLVAGRFASPSFKAVAETAALALTAACLKARALTPAPHND